MGRWYPSEPTFPQKLVALEYIQCHNGTEAYVRVYKCKRTSAEVGWAKLAAKPHFKRYLYQQERRAMKRSEITIDKILTDYQEALDLARKREDSGQIVNAAQAQAKLVGLLRDRVEQGNVGDFGDATSIEGILEILAKEAGEEAAMAFAAIFGLKLPENDHSKQMKEAALFIADPPSDAVN